MPEADSIGRRWRYDGKRVVVTGCASGIGACLVTQLRDLGAEIVGLDRLRPGTELDEFHEMDQADPSSIDRAVRLIGTEVDALFNIAGVSSGIGDPLRVATINFLGMRHFTEALVPHMEPGSAVVSVSSLAASGYLENRWAVNGFLETSSMQEGIDWCTANPEAIADGGYRLSKEAIILYTVRRSVELARRGIRMNCTGPGVTETPILDQLRSAYGQDYLDGIPKPLGRSADPVEQASALLFLGSRAAGYITGQVLWVDGGNLAAHLAGELAGPPPQTTVTGSPESAGAVPGERN
ncbi:coniferyl-alcohol dehydrogenase [Nocardia speluncae]|uniref:Coniferyl-alcohol dehydrogenase n=1 Tax=Nocardia speluncae TaxID=419477 RepID=A0A846XIN8_9NOCA|nr:coniferyl-alcohol dehydrogenase [Nocardia speluncae]NKY33684.1 coniferyl-alcohol dehydrogenase [Nocardia speluncae]